MPAYGTICWNCCRSAAPPSLQCVRDTSIGHEMPEGAAYKEVILSKQFGRKGASAHIVECPEFMDMNDPENLKILKEERKKNRVFQSLRFIDDL